MKDDITEFKRRVSRLKRRVPLKVAMAFDIAENFSIFNRAMVVVENKYRGKQFSATDYITFAKAAAKSQMFRDYCEHYIKNSNYVEAPAFEKRDKDGDWDIRNLKLKERQRKRLTNFKPDSGFVSMAKKMNNSVGLKFLQDNFEDVDKVRYLIQEIKPVNNYMSVKDKKEYLIKFYNDTIFNSLYGRYLKTNNKLIRPRLSLIDNDGEYVSNNIYFTSAFLHRAKADLNKDAVEYLIKSEQAYLLKF